MRRLILVVVLIAMLADLPAIGGAPVVFRVEGEALSSEPSWPAAAGALTVAYADSADEGQAVTVWGLTQSRAEVTDTTTGTTSESFLRTNRAWLSDGTAPLVATGTITVSHPTAGPLLLILPGESASRQASFSVGPGMATVRLNSVTGSVTRVMHRRGQAPQSASEVTIDGAAPGIGDFWIEGSGEVSMDLEAR